MKAEDIKRLYEVSPELHESIEYTLQQLDDASVVRYRKRRSVRRFVITFTVIASLVVFSTVAYATNLFGLLTKPVGKYGLNMHVVSESTSDTAEKPKHVKLKLGYVPEGYKQIEDENGFVEPNKYSYGGKSESDRWGFSFLIYSSDQYNTTETYIIEATEKTVNGHKIVFMTQQLEDNGKKEYIAAEYFDEWDTVVVGYCVNQEELAKIMEHLNLEEDTNHVEPEAKAIDDYDDDPYAEFDFSMAEETREYQLGETFTWTSQIVVAPSPAYSFKEGECKITVKSVMENNGIKDLDRSNLMAPDDEEWYSRYFNTDGSLKTPYTRTDRENGDGINSLGHIGSQEVNRHFYLVTAEVTNGSFTGQFMSNAGGAIYQEQHRENGADIYTVGIVADEDELDGLALSIPSKETVINDKTQTVVYKTIETVIPLSANQ